jgi:hypothetical protein
MTSRIFAIAVGIIAGLAALSLMILDWDIPLSLARQGPPFLAAALAPAPAHFAWIATLTVAAFTIGALLTALIAGLVETVTTLSRINRLRLDPALTEHWNAADWRSIFARTTVADRAEMIIAATPVTDGEGRRLVVDAHLLLGLARTWRERLTLSWSLTPLAAILLGLGALAALTSYAAGEDWSGALAAGLAGWLAVTIARYVVGVLLMPFVSSAVAGATAAIRPVTTIRTLETQTLEAATAAPAAAATPIDAQIIGTALADAIREPLSRLADATDRLGRAANPEPSLDSIDDALAEIRAGIERLLAPKR